MLTDKKGRIKKGNIPWNKGTKGVMKAWNKGTSGICKSNSGSFKKGHKISEKVRESVSKALKGKKKNYPVWNKGLGRIKCLYCNKIFKRDNKKIQYCSIKCRSLAFRGENAPNWKGGKVHRKKYEKRWKKDNHEKVIHYTRRRRMKKNGNGGSHTLKEWQELKKKYNWICPCCKKSEPEIKLTIDHIIPVKKSGSNNIENIQPLCQSCNSKKHTKTIKYKL